MAAEPRPELLDPKSPLNNPNPLKPQPNPNPNSNPNPSPENVKKESKTK